VTARAAEGGASLVAGSAEGRDEAPAPPSAVVVAATVATSFGASAPLSVAGLAAEIGASLVTGLGKPSCEASVLSPMAGPTEAAVFSASAIPGPPAL